jgi:hypothetical protein
MLRRDDSAVVARHAERDGLLELKQGRPKLKWRPRSKMAMQRS